MLKECADLLFSLDDGDLCIKHYLDHNPIASKQPGQLEGTLQRREILQRFSSIPGMISGNLSASMEELSKTLKEIRNIVKSEYLLIMEVFPTPESVFSLFLQKLFQSIFKTSIEEILLQSQSISLVSYLQTLFLCYQEISDSIQSIAKMIEEEANQYDSYVKEMYRLRDNIFALHLEKGVYISNEKQNLKMTISNLIEASKIVISVPKNPDKLSGLFKNTKDATVTESVIEITSNTITKIIAMLKDAVLRCVGLSAPQDQATNVNLLYQEFAEVAFADYFGSALEL